MMSNFFKFFLIAFVWVRIVFGFSTFILANVVAIVGSALLYVLLFFAPSLRSKMISKLIYVLCNIELHKIPYWLGGYDLFIDKQNADFSKPAIYVCNHISLFDPLIILGTIQNLGVLVKEKYTAIPAIWVLAKLFDFITIRSDDTESLSEILTNVSNSVKRGRSMLIFPEGRRAKVGRVIDFKRSAFKLAKDLNVRVVPIAIYSPRPFLTKGKFDIKEKTYYKIKILEQLSPENFKSSKQLCDTAYIQISNAVADMRDKSQEREQRYF